jgi:hypothetical protein
MSSLLRSFKHQTFPFFSFTACVFAAQRLRLGVSVSREFNLNPTFHLSVFSPVEHLIRESPLVIFYGKLSSLPVFSLRSFLSSQPHRAHP